MKLKKTTVTSLLLPLALLATQSTASAQDGPEGRDFLELFDKTSGGGASLMLIEPERLNHAPSRASLDRMAARSGRSKRQVARSFLSWLSRAGDHLPPASESARSDTDLDPDAILRNDPVTIVIFPGIFGEFIETRAFEEVFEKQSSAFRAEWQQRLAEQVSVPTDASFNLNTLRDEQIPLEKLVSISSIDDTNGEALVSIVLLRTPPLSLESTGTVAELAGIYHRRLNKVFEVLGRIPNTIGLVGYSMGTTTALQTLSDAGGDSWISNVRGMVSLAGVAFGSTAADVSFSTPPGAKPAASFTQLKLLRQLVADLEVPTGSGWAIAKTRFMNRHYWRKFALDILPTLKKPGAGPQPDLSLIRPDKARSMLEKAFLVASTSFDVGLSTENHQNNVRRWKQFVARVLDGTGELTTDARIDWWSTHTVPSHVKYYSIAGSLTGEETAPRGRELTGVMLGSIDYATNLGGWADYKSAGGTSINDGQVGAHQARFWPQLATFLNPNQEPFETEFLGVFKTHHWGLALRTGIGGTNPFPREALLKAIAAKIARDKVLDEAKEAEAPETEREGAASRLSATSR